MSPTRMDFTRILIVEDDISYAELLKIRLEKAGNYDAIIEPQPSRASATAIEFMPHLILLDLMLPGMDGGEVSRLFKKDERLQNIPVIFLTSAVTHDEVTAQGGMIGGKPFLAKPVNIGELVASIEKHLQK
jgi:DNA-binding response OmpR family regulator